MKYNVEIRFYLKLKDSLKKERPSNYSEDICNNSDCLLYKKKVNNHIKFCNNCGKKIVSKTLVTYSKIYPDCEELNEYLESLEIGDYNGDFFYQNEDREMEWLLEKNIKNTKYYKFEISSTEPMALSDINFNKELDIYKNDPFIKSAISKFEELYGENTVEMKIGLFSKYN